MTIRNGVAAKCVAMLLLAAAVTAPASAGDWPQWRHDAQRSAATDEKLPDQLAPLWTRQLPALKPAWEDQVAQGYMTFDIAYKPIVLGKRMFVGSSLNHTLTAYDTDSGKELWRFYAEGPIRMAPVGWEGNVYVAGDDGYLYCLGAADGAVRWKFQAGFDKRKIVGNEHLVSMWPVRGGPVVADGIVYFGASLWPVVGTFLHAVDAKTGKAVWTNSGASTEWKLAYDYQGRGRRSRPGMYGCVPQGYLVVAGDRIGVPQGRNMAQLFDRKTGDLMFHEVYGMHIEHNSAEYWYATTAGGNIFAGLPGAVGIDGKTGQMGYPNPIGNGIATDTAIYQVNGGSASARSAQAGYRPLWNFGLKAPAAVRGPGSYIKAGANLYAPGANGQLLIVKDVDVPARSCLAGPKLPAGEVWEMLAADGKLFVVTKSGTIACYGAGEGKAVPAEETVPLVPGASAAAQAAAALKAAKPAGGYAVVLGIKDGKLAEALLATGGLNVVAVGSDANAVDALRRRVDKAGLYGQRFCAYVADPLASGLPPYLASLLVSETLDADALAKNAREIDRLLRPYGGTACLADAGGLKLVVKSGAPEGSADWTHNNSNAANTLAGFDKLVKPPFGVLWFGGPGNAPILPRHGRGPSPTVSNGRLVIEGCDLLRCIDIYTGRLLWEHPFPGIGTFYNTGGKQLGTHETGPNYCMAGDFVYVITPAKCFELDAATGKQTREFPLPDGVEKDSVWATVRAEGKQLIATIRPLDVKRGLRENARYGAGAQYLAAYDRATGKCLWSKKAAQTFRSNGVAVTAGRVFAIDGVTAAELLAAKRRNDQASPAALVAFDASTGRQLWNVTDDVFGTWLGYSAEHDLLVQAGLGGGDSTAMAAHKGADGSRAWRQPADRTAKTPGFSGPPMIHHRLVVPQNGLVVELLTGKLYERTDLITGTKGGWANVPQGCGFTHSGEYMTLHRAWSHGGYTAIETTSEIYSFGGFRSGCTANMVPAGGVLTAPEYTRECECQFQNKCSVAMIHMPEMEQWAYGIGVGHVSGNVKRLGLNFGAPGDAVAEGGTLWIDCPDVGGPSPRVPVEIEPSRMGPYRDWLGNFRALTNAKLFAGKTYRLHSLAIQSGPLKWVTGSGILGATKVSVNLNGPGSYTVRLYFAEPEPDAKPGDRVFDLALAGKPVLPAFDPTAAAGGPRRGVVKEFTGVKVDGKLVLDLTARKGQTLLCGLELVAEN